MKITLTNGITIELDGAAEPVVALEALKLINASTQTAAATAHPAQSKRAPQTERDSPYKYTKGKRPLMVKEGSCIRRGPGYVASGAATAKVHAERDDRLKSTLTFLWSRRDDPDGVFWSEISKEASCSIGSKPVWAILHHLEAHCKALKIDANEVVVKRGSAYFAGPQLCLFMKQAFDVDLTPRTQPGVTLDQLIHA